MKTRLHNLTHTGRSLSVVRRGGIDGAWRFGWLGRLICSRFFAELKSEVHPAGVVAIHATKCPAMRNRVALRVARKA